MYRQQYKLHQGPLIWYKYNILLFIIIWILYFLKQYNNLKIYYNIKARCLQILEEEQAYTIAEVIVMETQQWMVVMKNLFHSFGL